MSKTTTALIELRRHYEQIVAQSEYQAAQASAQLEHIDALLVNGLLQGEMPVFSEAIPADRLALTAASVPDSFTEDDEIPPDTSDAPAPESSVSQSSSKGDRTPRTLMPAYEGMKRLEAIAKAMEATPGEEMTIDSLIQELFGNLSATDHKAERKRLNTLLYKGEKLGLWKKGKASSSYLVDESGTDRSKAAAPTSTAQPSTSKTRKAARTSGGRDSLPMLSEYDGMTKLEAISKVLTDQSGHVLHQDSIIQLLYGDLSPDVLNEETRRLRASLFQGVRKGLWQKAAKQPSSYLVKASKLRKAKEANNGAGQQPEIELEAPPVRKPGRKANTSKPSNSAKSAAKPKSASRGREQVLSLPSEFDGLSKIDAVAKVLNEHPGTVVHIEDIIKRFYGELNKADLKAEKDRMKDVMTRGVKRNLWSRATGIPSSYVVKES